MGFKKGKDPNRYILPPGTTIKKKQNAMRDAMAVLGPDVVSLISEVILKGTIDGEKISAIQRMDMIKMYMPYVLPVLKSTEIKMEETNKQQPLIINLAGIGNTTNVKVEKDITPSKPLLTVAEETADTNIELIVPVISAADIAAIAVNDS